MGIRLWEELGHEIPSLFRSDRLNQWKNGGDYEQSIEPFFMDATNFFLL
jgi:hypothetical protein